MLEQYRIQLSVLRTYTWTGFSSVTWLFDFCCIKLKLSVGITNAHFTYVKHYEIDVFLASVVTRIRVGL